MDSKIRGAVGVQSYGATSGATPILRADQLGGLGVSALLAPYFTAVKQGIVFGALAQTLTAPVIWSTAAGQGLVIYNGSTDKDVVLLAVGYSTLVASTVAGTLGIAQGLTTAPGSVTVADARWNARTSGSASAATPYKTATPTAAATSFFPIIRASTTALTAELGLSWSELKGLSVIEPGGFAACAAGSATLTTMQMAAAVLWMEVPR